MISSVGSQVQTYTSTKIASTQKSFTTSSSDKATSTDNSILSSTISNLAQEYGSVREISPPAMTELANKLFEAGELSLLESGILGGMPKEVVRSESGEIMELRTIDSTEFKYDYMANIEGALERAKMSNETQNIKTFENILSVFDKLENAMNDRINLTA